VIFSNIDDILIYLDTGKVFILKYLDFVHPIEVHPQADHHEFIFQLYRNNKKFDKGFFKDIYFVSEDKKVLILVEYDQSITRKSKIRLRDDIILNLRLFDFENHKTGKFSKIAKGVFLVKSYNDKKVIFQKIYSDKSVEYETRIEDIDFKDII
jgi:hypothetical protein